LGEKALDDCPIENRVPIVEDVHMTTASHQHGVDKDWRNGLHDIVREIIGQNAFISTNGTAFVMPWKVNNK
jgi:hypothetical protein